MTKINWFDADRALSTNVSEFMRTQVWKKEISLRYGKDIADTRASLENLEKLQGSILAEKIPEMRTTYLARIAELERERDTLIEEQATYAAPAADKAFLKAIRKDSTTAATEIEKWFARYHLTINEDLINEILTATGEKQEWKTTVQSDGKVVTAFNVTNCLKMVYLKAYEHMVNAGTIKAAQIPTLLREKYGRKQKKSGKK